MFVCKDENKRKRSGDGPFKKDWLSTRGRQHWQVIVEQVKF